MDSRTLFVDWTESGLANAVDEVPIEHRAKDLASSRSAVHVLGRKDGRLADAPLPGLGIVFALSVLWDRKSEDELLEVHRYFLVSDDMPHRPPSICCSDFTSSSDLS